MLLILLTAILCYCHALGECASLQSVDTRCSPGNWTSWDDAPGPEEVVRLAPRRYYPVWGGAVSVRAPEPLLAVPIFLMEHAHTRSDGYRILLRANGECRIDKNLKQMYRGYINMTDLSHEGFVNFWVSWECGDMSVGRHGERVPLISWTDPEPLSVRFVRFHRVTRGSEFWIVKGLNNTADSLANSESDNSCSSSNWTVWDDAPGPKEGVTVSDPRFRPVSSGAVSVRLPALFSNERIDLVERALGADHRYTISLWYDGEIKIFKDSTQVHAALRTMTGVNHKSNFGFWVSWKCGAVSVGLDGEGSPVLKWVDLEPFPVHYAKFYQSLTEYGYPQVKGLDSATDDGLVASTTDSLDPTTHTQDANSSSEATDTTIVRTDLTDTEDSYSNNEKTDSATTSKLNII